MATKERERESENSSQFKWISRKSLAHFEEKVIFVKENSFQVRIKVTESINFTL